MGNRWGEGSASDPDGVERVKLYKNGVEASSDSSDPYTWNLTNLGSGTWVSATYTVVGTNPVNGEYDEVTNEISTDDPNVFIRLKILNQ